MEAATKNAAPCLAFDVLRIMQQMDLRYTGSIIQISDGFFREYHISKYPDFLNINFLECYFTQIEVDDGANAGPRFEKCQIDRIVGCIGADDLPDFMRPTSNHVTKYEDEAQTNADILDLPIPTSTKVLMTILRKLFVQAGRGRKENAFYRGLDGRAKVYVPAILALIEQMNFASPHKISGPVVWFPNRSVANEAHSILQSPQQNNNNLAVQVRML
jgi:hypothetical protein